MKRVIFGPLQTGEGFLFTYYQDQYYVLKNDPNPSFGLYFGLNRGLSGDYSMFTVTKTTTSTVDLNQNGRYLAVENNQVVWSANGLSTLTFEYVQPIVNMLLYPAENVTLSNLLFPLKLEDDEQLDLENSQNVDYEPTYNAVISEVFFVPLYSIPSYNCQALDTFGAYLAYSTLSSNSTFFTVVDYCERQVTQPLCENGAPCSEECIGHCTSGVCLPVEDESPCVNNKNWFESPLFYFILGTIIVAVIISILVGVYFLSKPKVTSNTRVVYA